MSHAPERQEKDCLNCGTIVQGRYCQHCGQENIVPRESFGQLVLHFFYDLTHFDSKFFDTLKYLLFRPGFLPKEYVKGRRMRYLNPLRMYIFTSAFFFLLFFAIRGEEMSLTYGDNEPISYEHRQQLIQKFEKTDSTGTLTSREHELLQLLKDTSNKITKGEVLFYSGDFKAVSLYNVSYETVAAYDSAQQKLEPGKRDGWFRSLLIRRQLQVNEKFKENPQSTAEKFSGSLLHKLPYMLFVSLPLFALMLKLLYIRRRKFYYAEHAIFTVHLYIFSFILLMFVFLFDWLYLLSDMQFFDRLKLVVFLLWPIYLLLALKRFYSQNWLKTCLKFLLLIIFGFAIMVFLFFVFLVASLLLF